MPPSALLLRLEIPSIGISRTAQLALDSKNHEKVLRKVSVWCDEIKNWDPNRTVIHDQLNDKDMSELVQHIAGVSSEPPSHRSSRRSSSVDLPVLQRARPFSRTHLQTKGQCIASPMLYQSLTDGLVKPAVARGESWSQGLIQSLDTNIAMLRRAAEFEPLRQGFIEVSPPVSPKIKKSRPRRKSLAGHPKILFRTPIKMETFGSNSELQRKLAAFTGPDAALVNVDVSPEDPLMIHSWDRSKNYLEVFKPESGKEFMSLREALQKIQYSSILHASLEALPESPRAGSAFDSKLLGPSTARSMCESSAADVD